MTHSTYLRTALALAMTMALAPLALDTYLPAFPAIAESLQVRVHDVSLSIAVYVFCLAAGQLIGGPLSDRLGRQRVMFSGLALFAVASLLLAAVETLPQLLLLRALQAFGGGWAMVCVPALVRDQFSGQEAARFFSLIGLITIVAPAVAPSFGSLLLAQWGWPEIFLFLGFYALLMIALLRAMVFRHPSVAARAAPLAMSLWQRYAAVLRQRAAMRFLLLQTFAFAVMLLFITHAPYLYQEHFGVGPNAFSLLFGANVVLMLAVNLINRRLLHSMAAMRILRAGLTLQAVGVALLLLVLAVAPTLWLFLPAMMITVGAMGAIGSNTQACFMEYFPHNSGTAAALLGASQFALGGVITGLSTLLPESVWSVVAAQAVCSVVCLWLIWTRKADHVATA